MVVTDDIYGHLVPGARGGQGPIRTASSTANFIIIYVQFYVNIKIIYESTESTIRVLRGGTNVDLGSV